MVIWPTCLYLHYFMGFYGSVIDLQSDQQTVTDQSESPLKASKFHHKRPVGSLDLFVLKRVVNKRWMYRNGKAMATKLDLMSTVLDRLNGYKSRNG